MVPEVLAKLGGKLQGLRGIFSPEPLLEVPDPDSQAGMILTVRGQVPILDVSHIGFFEGEVVLRVANHQLHGPIQDPEAHTLPDGFLETLDFDHQLPVLSIDAFDSGGQARVPLGTGLGRVRGRSRTWDQFGALAPEDVPACELRDVHEENPEMDVSTSFFQGLGHVRFLSWANSSKKQRVRLGD
jgi:hypothetical protein